ncbi:hypothetical protein PoB_003613900 [Plakobranchus ocellatus]|uniref:DDE Tnp4 domain-containing protein n=1 Tax=Plakobranchus ocellatus TaxID=259542 RepID=A0AAV4APA4_9GAST|nr:hypothetical protein PoB_003613900 [Plakobranchus ocellatus]
MLPNGIIGHMFEPMEGKHHDSALLATNGLIAEVETIDNFSLYGDQAYPLRRTLISPFRDIESPTHKVMNAKPDTKCPSRIIDQERSGLPCSGKGITIPSLSGHRKLFGARELL